MLPFLMYTGPWGGKCTLHNLGAVLKTQASEKVQSAQRKTETDAENQFVTMNVNKNALD